MANEQQVPPDWKEGRGTVLRLPDGSIYFFREEILDACRVTGEKDLQRVEEALAEAGEVSGFGFDTLDTSSIGVTEIQGPMPPAQFETMASGKEMPTLMCPW